MKVGDLVIYWDIDMHVHHRIWQVKSVCLGALNQESLVELKNLHETPGRDTENAYHRTTWVPEVLLRQMPIYTNIHENGPTGTTGSSR